MQAELGEPQVSFLPTCDFSPERRTPRGRQAELEEGHRPRWLGLDVGGDGRGYLACPVRRRQRSRREVEHEPLEPLRFLVRRQRDGFLEEVFLGREVIGGGG